MSLLELRCDSHTYPDGTEALCGVEFAVDSGELVAVCGGNGAGKSTLLEHLNGLLTPDEGTLRLAGDPVTDENIDRVRQAVGLVFQDADSQLVAPTVVDDVTFGPKNFGASDAEALERAERALERVGASHLRNRIPHYLSGGEKRLVALAGVLATDPEVVAFDEPLTGLDPARSRLVGEQLRRLRADGLGVVVSTHDLDFAAAAADRIVVMDAGRVVEEGPPRAVCYDDDLLSRANLEPPTVVRLARRVGLEDARPVTEDELAERLAGLRVPETDGPRVGATDGLDGRPMN